MTARQAIHRLEQLAAEAAQQLGEARQSGDVFTAALLDQQLGSILADIERIHCYCEPPA